VFSGPTGDRVWSELAELSRRVAGRYVSRDRADDISQEVFLLLWVSDPPKDARMFVSALARRLALSHLRSERRRLDRERTWVRETATVLMTPEAPGDGFRGLKDLQPRKRLLAEMLIAGYSVREIGARLEAPKSNVQREIEALRAQFGRVPSPGSAGRVRNGRTSRPTISKKRSA